MVACVMLENPHRCLRLLLLLLVGVVNSSHADTVVHLGEIREFNGPDDLNLDPARVVVAIDCFGDSDRVVNGVLFKTDRTPPAGCLLYTSPSPRD